jgi:hypothetical protein
MWPDFRVVNGDIVEENYGRQSGAFRILLGKALETPSFDKVQYETHEEGCPIHAVSYPFGDCTLRMECFCTIERVPDTYVRFSVKNETVWPIRDEVALMPRTGQEPLLTCMDRDGYSHLDNNVGNWGFILNTWHFENGSLSDGVYDIQIPDNGGFTLSWRGDVPETPWQHKNHLRIEYDLAPGEEKSLICVFRSKKSALSEYGKEKIQAESFWRREFERIRAYPGTDTAIERLMCKTLVAQCLQMFSYPIGKEYVLPRQGGLERAVWPAEAVEFLIALDRIGNFNDYTQTAYDYFFDVLQRKDGEEKGEICNRKGFFVWGCITGASIWGVARHMIYTGDAAYKRYRDPAYHAFCWMQRQRNQGVEYGVKGIFPPMQASDWNHGGDRHLSWCWTDGINLLGYRWLAAAFRQYKDPAAEEITQAYDDYMQIMKGILSQELEKNDRTDEIIISNMLGEPMSDPPPGPYFNDGPANLMRVGIIEPGSEAARLVEGYYKNRCLMKNGLTGMMSGGWGTWAFKNDPWAGHTWYTNYPDLCWFLYYLRGGKREKALEILNAQLRYSMTPEFYMLERYADNDPYFVPWLPNASANGRTLMMLSDFYNGGDNGENL